MDQLRQHPQRNPGRFFLYFCLNLAQDSGNRCVSYGADSKYLRCQFDKCSFLFGETANQFFIDTEIVAAIILDYHFNYFS